MSLLSDAPLALHLITIIVASISSFAYTKIVSILWKCKINSNLFSIVFALLLGISIWVTVFFKNEILSYFLIIIIEFGIITLLTDSKVNQVASVVMGSIIHYMVAKSFSIGLLSLILKKNMYFIVTNQNTLLIALLIGSVLKIIILYFNFIKEDKKKLLLLFNTESELNLVLYIHSSLFVFILFFSYNYFYNLDLVWFTFAQIILSAIVVILYSQILSYGLRISYMLEIELYNQRINQQLNNQISLYNNIKSREKDRNSAIHLFRELLLTTESYIKEGKSESALSLIEKSYGELSQIAKSVPKNSNNDSVNATLYSWEAFCEQKNISFNAKIQISSEVEPMVNDILKMIALLQMFYDYLVFEATSPSIALVGQSKHNLFSLKIKGTVDRIIQEKNGEPYFNFKNGKYLESNYRRIKAIVDSYDGLINYKFNVVSKTFEILITIQSK